MRPAIFKIAPMIIGRTCLRQLTGILFCAAMLGRASAAGGADESRQLNEMQRLSEMQRLMQQTREYSFSSLNPERPPVLAPRNWAAALRADGSWRDVDYGDQTRDNWKAEVHLKRTLGMATLFAQEQQQGGRRDGALAAAALRAAHYWISHDFQNPNWWQNEIGVPGDMANILLMMGDEMSPADRAGGLKIAARATLTRTGQNLVWMAGIAFRRALVQGDAALARQARDTILKELVVTPQEGLQADASFHQHGPQQQMGNYGLSFATDLVAWARIWQGTSFALPPEKMALLRAFLLRGEAAMTVNGVMDISGCGRQLAAGSPAGKGRKVIELLGAMPAVDPAHAQAYRTAARQDSQPTGSGVPPGPGAVMNWNFFRSDTMIHRRPGFYASVKLCSNRVIGGELVNGENLQGRYLADGATFLYQTSREYTDIFPVWDWRRVPGVTCATSGTTLAPEGMMQTDFAGGVSDGAYGAEGVDYRRDGVTGRKGWFFLDEEVVCLGAGISGTGVRTSVEQRLSQGDTWTSAGKAAPGVQLCKGAAWVLNGAEGYLFPQPRDVWAGMQTQTGAWKSVYTSGPATPITKPVFSIWLEHAASPDSYAYALVPGATAEKLAADAAHPRFEILSNTPVAQAVRDRAAGVTEALFYQAGEVAAGGLSIRVDGPCAILLHAGAVSVADPTQKEKTVSVTINGKPAAVSLPQGQFAGNSTRVPVR